MTSQEMARYIRDHYELREIEGGWEALSYGLDPQDGGKPAIASRIQGSDREAVCREARCQWGHFNFRAEAKAFNEIFPPNYEGV